MTRFARAKGSKSSNEKKPEEATSWAEMKNAMVSKKSNKLEEFKPKKEVKSDIPKQVEWASLEGNLSDSTSLLKQNLRKKIKDSDKIKNNNTNNVKSKNPDNLGNKLKPESEKFAFQKKNKVSQEVNLEKTSSTIKKKNRKRKFTEIKEESELVLTTKKEKQMKNQDTVFEAEEKQEQNLKNKEIKECKKFCKMKKEMKTKYFEKVVKGNLSNNNNKNKRFNEKFNKQSKTKKFKNKSFKEGNLGMEELIINGQKIPIVKFEGFYVTLEDAERLKKLRREMIKEGISKAKLEAAIKLERRRAEKALARLKKRLCFHCRGHGHLLSNCPKLIENEHTSTGICYKCGSTEHSAAECRVVKGSSYQFAECFICKEQGHIARQCPDNPRGLYPQGGGCRECGDVTHLRKDCPKVMAQKAEEVVTVGFRNDRNLECLDEEIASREEQNSKNNIKKSPSVKF